MQQRKKYIYRIKGHLIKIYFWYRLSHREPASGPLAGCILSGPSNISSKSRYIVSLTYFHKRA
jgi:hypothetical protein